MDETYASTVLFEKLCVESCDDVPIHELMHLRFSYEIDRESYSVMIRQSEVVLDLGMTVPVRAESGVELVHPGRTVKCLMRQ